MLAPLAGVSDSPFRRICTELGADLSYVEMLSSVALAHGSKKTLKMLERHPSEAKLGVQITGRSADDFARAVEVLNRFSLTTIDINMGCPVRKVVQHGCGSALLRDVAKAHTIIKTVVNAARVPVSVKIRLGWDHASRNFLELGRAAQDAGACWVTVHGRTRSDDYSREVDLAAIYQLSSSLDIPVIGNGNLFGPADALHMRQVTGVAGLMVSRGALGNPWVFSQIKGKLDSISLDQWHKVVSAHLSYQRHWYGDNEKAVIVMRKHLLWYLKGWPHAKRYREKLSQACSFAAASEILAEFRSLQQHSSNLSRQGEGQVPARERFIWDPKFDMSKDFDRGVYR